jgi:CRP-like cAMP-binding protein
MRLRQLLNTWGKARRGGSSGPAATASATAGNGDRRSIKVRYLSAIDDFCDLSPAELERLAKTTTMITCPRGRVIYRAGDAGDTLFLLKAGRIQIVRETADGKRLVIAVLGPGTFFGEMVLLGERLPRDSTAEALEDALICVMSRRDVEQLILADPKVGLRFLEQVGARLAETEAMVEEFAFKAVPARLAGVLLRLADTEGGDPATIEVTHQELADMVATYRETVTVVLHQFRQRGLVELGRRGITILDRKGLDDQAGAEA